MGLDRPVTSFPLRLPLVVPSFSSRGFPQDRSRLKEVTSNHFRDFAGNFEALLVSAFDLHFGYVDPVDLPPERMIFVDSGGYEAREWEDDSATHLKHLPHAGEKWTSLLLQRTIRRLPDEPRFVYVNFDREEDLVAQVHSATRQMRRFRKACRSFLLKEEQTMRRGRPVSGPMVPIEKTLAKLPKVAEALAGFEVFGVTEKSLGSSYHTRLANLHFLCRLLQKLGLNLPVHVFGALDPLSVRAYAMAGASIFDGLTWIRFAYRRQQCVYLSNDLLAESDLQENFTEGRNAVYNRNYLQLVKLQAELQRYRQADDEAVLNLHPRIKAKVNLALDYARRSDLFRKFIGSGQSRTRFPLARAK